MITMTPDRALQLAKLAALSGASLAETVRLNTGIDPAADPREFRATVRFVERATLFRDIYPAKPVFRATCSECHGAFRSPDLYADFRGYETFVYTCKPCAEYILAEDDSDDDGGAFERSHGC